MNYATEKEMIDHCNRYPCSTCTIARKCSMFEALFGYLPNTPNHAMHSDGEGQCTTCGGKKDENP